MLALKICNRIGLNYEKVTLQEIANSLGISRTTVWKVFSGHEGVSDSLRTKVIAKAQELGYAIPEDFQYPQSAEETTPVNIAVAVCRPETSLFWMTIIHQIAKVFSTHNVNLVYTYLPTSADKTYFLPPTLTNGNVHGIIVLNVYNERLLRLLAETQIPKVFLDTSSLVAPDELNGDLLLMESRTSVRRITCHLLEQGRTLPASSVISATHSPTANDMKVSARLWRMPVKRWILLSA